MPVLGLAFGLGFGRVRECAGWLGAGCVGAFCSAVAVTVVFGLAAGMCRQV